MKKILFILQWPPPVHGSSVVGSYIKNSTLINQEFGTDYINLSTSRKIDEIGKYNLIKVYVYIKILLKIIYKNITNRYDIIYMAISINGKAVYKDALIVFILKLFKQKLVFHLHNKGASQYNSNNRRLIYKYIFKNVSVILISKYLYEDIKNYVPLENVYICHNGIPDLTTKILKDKKSLSFNLPVNFLFLSNMIESKGVFVLLEACSILKRKGKKFICHFVGAWKDINEKDFVKTLKDLRIGDCVLFHGPKYGDEKNKYWKLANVFVFPTYYKQECFPLVLLEAMKHSLPMISTYEGGIPDIILDNETGFLCKQEDSNCLANKMEILIDGPQLRTNMGIVGRKCFNEKFMLSIFENRLVNILMTISDM